MQDSESLKHLPPVSEGGPKSSELLPPEITDFENFTNTTLGLIERQTGVAATPDMALREDYTVSRRVNRGEEASYGRYIEKKATIVRSQGLPFATTQDGWNIKTHIGPAIRDQGWSAGISKGRSEVMTYRLDVQSRSLNNAYISISKGVEEDTDGGTLIFQYNEGKNGEGTKWGVEVSKTPGQSNVDVKVFRDGKEIQEQKTGFLGRGPKVQKPELAKRIIGETIDQLPKKGSFALNPDYGRGIPERQFGI